MDLSVLNPFDPANREGLIVAAFLLAVAMAGKVAAGWSYFSSEPTNRLVVGLGMMPRGEVGLIFLGLGSQAGILTPALEAAILLMVIGTTFLAPILRLSPNSCRCDAGAFLCRWCDCSHHPPWQGACHGPRLRRWPWGQAPAL
jgi:Kef-type K+ transport system membrane component KefB